VKAFILLKADEGEQGEGWTDQRIADAYNISVSTVEQTRERFVEDGMEGALNRRPTSRVYRRKIEGEEEAHLIALACSPPPEGRCQWTMQLLADKMVELNYVDSVSDETVRQVLNRNEIKPWHREASPWGKKRVVYPARAKRRLRLPNGRGFEHLHSAIQR
jgi:transposase